MAFDFGNEASLGTNRSHILDLIVLGRRDEWLNTFQKYRIACMQNDSNKTILFSSLRAILETIEFEIRETFKRRLKKDPSYDKFKLMIDKCSTDEELVKAFDVVNSVLDGLRITRIDNRKYVDSTDIEATNLSKGL